jgi:hypothetical protein
VVLAGVEYVWNGIKYIKHGFHVFDAIPSAASTDVDYNSNLHF